MIVPGSANPLLLGDAGYKIQRSLRFRSSASAYLNRTPASNGNTQIYTISKWIKRGQIGTPQNIVRTSTVSGTATEYMFESDNLRIYYYTAGAYVFHKITTAVYRDPSAWYHIVVAVDTTQATAANRVKMYVNGNQITSFSTSIDPPQNATTDFNTAKLTYIGGITYFDGYMAEFNAIDGQALTPSSFGQTDPVTGVWTPKKYTGTYGTNGFYLDFKDNTSATTLAYDKSGNGNNWTPNNISTTAGATYDSMTDVPTLTSASAANYCTWNPLDAAGTPSNGNLLGDTGSSGSRTCVATMAMQSGKYYWEVQYTSGSGTDLLIGIAGDSFSGKGSVILLNAASGWSINAFNGNLYNNGSNSAYGTSFTTNDIISVAYDADTGKVWFAKNGTWMNSGNPATGTNPATSSATAPMRPAIASGTAASQTAATNFGQRPFSYTPPTGFKALNTYNLPDPTIKKPNQYMDATTYTGTGSTRSVTNAAGFQPDLVWVKTRSDANSSQLTDSVRGNTLALASNLTLAEYTGEISINSTGYSVSGGAGATNYSGWTYVGWQWKAGGTAVTNTSGSITSTVSVNTTAGFSVVTYTGNNLANQSVGHGLGVAPSLVITKNRDISGSSSQWITTSSILGVDKYLLLNSTAAVTTASGYLPLPSSSVVYVSGANSGDNNAANKFVAYCWAQIAGFSKFGSFVGNGSADGTFVYTGFRPKFLMIKCTNTTGDWYMFDTSRDPSNGVYRELEANLSNAEYTTATPDNDILSNGFKQRYAGGTMNTNGNTYIYAAFAESPFKYALGR